MTEQGKVLKRASKAIVDDYYRMDYDSRGKKGTVSPSPINFDEVREIVFGDEEVRGFIGNLVDAVYSAGYTLKGSKSAVEDARKKLKAVSFDKHLKKLYNYLLTDLHAFVEFVPSRLTAEEHTSKQKIVDLNVWNSRVIEPEMTEKGIVTGYVYMKNDPKLKTPFNLEEMKDLKVEDSTNGFWSYPQLLTVKKLIELKWQIINLLDWMYKTNQFRAHFHAKGLSKDDVEALTTLVREGMKQPDKFLFTIGKEEMHPTQIMTGADLQYHLAVLQEIRSKIMTALRLPPIIAGVVEDSNRSNSDIQARFAFKTRLESFCKEVEQEIEKTIFKRLGIKNVEIVHNSIDIKSKKETMDIASQIMNAGGDKEKVEEWLNNNGFDLPEGIFKNADEGVELDKNSKLHPSRKEKDNFGNSDYGEMRPGVNE